MQSGNPALYQQVKVGWYEVQNMSLKVLTTLKNLATELQIPLQELDGLEKLAALRNNQIALALWYLLLLHQRVLLINNLNRSTLISAKEH